jgi:transposase
MHPTYEELFSQNQILIQQLKEALLEIQALKAENQALKTKIKELEEKLNTNSSNSSKPPSQDPFRAHKKKQPTGRKQGAQPGHPRHQRPLVPIEGVKKVYEIKPDICSSCGKNAFDDTPVRTEIRQVTELPEIQPEVIQYNIHTCSCSCCGKHVRAQVPQEAVGAFGPRLMGFISILSAEFHATKRKVVNLLGYLNIRISLGTVCKTQAIAGLILEKPYEIIRQHTLNQSNVNGDETSWKVFGKRFWMWIVTTVKSAFFKIDPSRSSEAFKRVYGSSFEKPLTTDRCPSYNEHHGERQLCLGHIDRDFEKIAGRGDFDAVLGDYLKKEMDGVFKIWHSFKDAEISRTEMREKIENQHIASMKVLLEIGTKALNVSSKTQNTCDNLLKDFPSMWTFLKYEGIEPTNNLAERDLRHGVIWRKISFGNQSDTGKIFVERMLTVITTMKKQAQNAFDYIIKCFQAHKMGREIPIPLLN